MRFFITTAEYACFVVWSLYPDSIGTCLIIRTAADVNEDSDDEDGDDLGGLFKVLKKQKGDGSQADKHIINKADVSRIVTDDKKDFDEVLLLLCWCGYETGYLKCSAVGVINVLYQLFNK